MKTILYATDYSDQSIGALQIAQTLSQHMNASLVVTHVFSGSTLSSDFSEDTFPLPDKDLFEQHHKKLSNFCEKNSGNHWEKINASLEVVKNTSVVNGILGKIDEIFASVIIVGMKGESKLRGSFLGNTTTNLIDKAPCPVLSVPEIVNPEKLETVVYATDYEEDDIFAIKRLISIIKPFGAKICVVHISPEHEYVGDEQMEWFKEILLQKVQYENMQFDIIFSDQVFEELNQYLAKVDADLLVMLEREDRNFLKKVFRQDLVKKMKSHISIPLLSYNKINF